MYSLYVQVNAGGFRHAYHHALRRASPVTLAFRLTLSGAAIARSTGAIEGTVVSRGDGAPVPGAVVTAEGGSLAAVTNAIGRFEIPGAPAGSVTLIVSAPGYLELRVPDVRMAAGAVTVVQPRRCIESGKAPADKT